MSIVRMGTTKKYSDNWDNIFGGNGREVTTKRAKPAKASAKKSLVKKKAPAKPAKKARKRK